MFAGTQDQILAVADRLDLARQHVGEAQLVGLTVVLVVDDAVAGVAPDKMDVGAAAAAQGLVSGSEVDVIGAAGAGDLGRVRRMGDQALLADAERVGDAAHVEVETDGLEGRQQHQHLDPIGRIVGRATSSR